MNSQLSKMVSSLILVFCSLGAGYIIQIIMSSTGADKRFSIEKVRRFIQKFMLLVLIPITVVGSIWIAPLKHVEIISLPLLGVFTILLGGLLGFILSKPLSLSREQRGVYTVAGGFTNMGSLGGLVAFILLGESGFALVAFYQLFEKLVYFGFGFPLAKNHSRHKEEKQSIKGLLVQAIADPVIIVNLAALILGIILNLTGAARPGFYSHINKILVPLSSAGLLISIGLAMRFSRMSRYWKPASLMILIKSAVIPAATFFLGWLLGLGTIENGLVLKFLLIITAMPVGFMSLVPPTLYDLDLDLANTCWLFSTAALIIVVPVLTLLIPLI